MDDRAFDSWVRSLRDGVSRRGALRGLAVAGAAVIGIGRVDRAGATAYSVPLGGACIRSHQCIQYLVSTRGYDPSAQAVACDFNGFAADGEFNCCRYRGGFCSSNHECCGYLHCRGRTCNS